MRLDKIEQFLPLIMAAKDGRTIQYKNKNGNWQDCLLDDESTFADGFEYREKPAEQESPKCGNCWHFKQRVGDSGRCENQTSIVYLGFTKQCFSCLQWQLNPFNK